jgi:hypothetical protein
MLTSGRIKEDEYHAAINNQQSAVYGLQLAIQAVLRLV